MQVLGDAHTNLRLHAADVEHQSTHLDVAGARRAMKLPTDRTAVASIKEVNTGPKSKNLSDSIILELLD